MATEETDPSSSVARYLSADIADRPALIAEVFTPGAVVHDEGRTYTGTEEIRRWATDLAENLTFDGKIEKIVRDGSRVSAEVLYTGDFPGSPARVTSHFTLDGNLIAEIDNQG